MVERSTVRIRRLSDDRVEEARFGRWLNNAKVRLVEMERTIGEQMRRAPPACMFWPSRTPAN